MLTLAAFANSPAPFQTRWDAASGAAIAEESKLQANDDFPSHCKVSHSFL
jgi:hypothetical protein